MSTQPDHSGAATALPASALRKTCDASQFGFSSTAELDPVDDLIDSQAQANFWDPSTQLRVIKKKGAIPEYPQRPSEAATARDRAAAGEAAAGWGD